MDDAELRVKHLVDGCQLLLERLGGIERRQRIGVPEKLDPWDGLIHCEF
jgi:hypothetical protein